MDNLLKKVVKLVKDGHGRVIVSRELGISGTKATALIKKARELTSETLPQPDRSPVKAKANGTRRNDKNIPKKLLQQLYGLNTDNKIEALMDRGFGCRKISYALGIAEVTIESKMRKIRGLPSKKSRIETLNEKIHEGKDLYDLAVEMCVTPNGVKQLMAKSGGTYNPAATWLYKAAKEGIKFSFLRKELKIDNISRAYEVLEQAFPKHFIVRTNLADGDILLMPVQDSKDEHEWLQIDTSKKQFKYFVSPDSNYMTVQFDDDLPGSEIIIYNITDIHVGSKAFRSDMLQEMIETIATDPNAFFVIGGDLIEAVTKSSVADPAEQYEGLNNQAVEAVKTFMPIAHKCLAIEWGNHCGGRTEKAAQFDLARIMAEMLKVPYFRVRVLIDLHFRGETKTISLAHKYGNAISQSSIVGMVKKVLSQLITPVHCFFSGHNHHSFVQPEELLVKVPGKGFETITYYIANGGSFVVYTGTYAEQAGYGRSPQDVVYFKFDEQGNHSAGTIPFKSN